MKITDSELTELRKNPNQNKSSDEITYNIGDLRKSTFTITKASEIQLAKFKQKTEREVAKWK